jgi:hypothetical protein
MYLEEAAWLRRELAQLALSDGARVLNVASSTEHYRTIEQPHNESEVLAPLRDRGAAITHLDIKAAPGVDVVCDLLADDIDLNAFLGSTYWLVLVTGLLEHVPQERVPGLLSRLQSVVEPGGALVVTTPFRYRRTEDPFDFGYRPSPGELQDLLLADPQFEPITAELVRIDAPQYYKGFISRASVIPVGRRWISMPGVAEQLRRLVKPWRWQESCVIAGRRTDAV